MKHHPPNNLASYYVPHQSAWPILGALALLILAFASLNLTEKWGFAALLLGLCILLFMLGGWLWSVTKESNAGLYNQQMDRTFRWGMLWFLVSELFLFGLLLGSIVHVRFSITPWLAGESGAASMLTHYLLWPDFSQHWPLTVPPADSPPTTATYLDIAMKGLPFFNVILLMLSTLVVVTSKFFLKKGQYQRSFMILNVAIFCGILFLGLQIYYGLRLIAVHIILKTGIYGSLLIALLGLHIINILAALLCLIGASVRLHHQKLTNSNTFLLDAGIWWWIFLTGIWLIGVFLIF